MFTPLDTFPYIGLRPFSEEDSLYFKGREEQILQLTALLEANKFLMVTGASGDGKSSLVYAGLVPNARAGFFKAKYTNWVVADFRPERTPLHNLSKTISRSLRIGNEESVEVELRRGFSSLVELYSSSSLFLDEQSEAWSSAGDDARDDLQRTSANLLIVADQFEEFFTNPENYYRNAPSADSQLVINLLLETARISIAKNLPVYIVCTMRSDYIGQCAAFRGLPEFIGFSQFFVPRLKRKELTQVVKEPAHLHGDRISNRLVERVVYDLGEGIDQLPVLEHAMNEVWIQAKERGEEMDLFHYAMAGGMPLQDLPAEDREAFRLWFTALPLKLQDAYQKPGLSHIIDTHANKLYLSAADHYNQARRQNALSVADAQLIIKTAFTCLTKMDEGRAVRNRMTLQEITDILARPELNSEVVGGVLNIFREPGNTFLRPYISDAPESQSLKPEDVLDITHESLIRNWELLLSWAKEEFDSLTVYEDFKKQLDRWIASKKSKGFLLPIGPLTYFESWFNKLNPNRYWVYRYLNPDAEVGARMKEAVSIVADARDFIHKSSRNHLVTRTVVKYGASKIATVIALFFIVSLCSFYYYDSLRKQNEKVISRLLDEGGEFIPDNKIDLGHRSQFLINSEKLRPGSYRQMLDRVPDEQKTQLVNGMSGALINTKYDAKLSLRRQLIYYSDSVLHGQYANYQFPKDFRSRLKDLNDLFTNTNIYLRIFHDKRTEEIKENTLQAIKEILLGAFKNTASIQKEDVRYVNDGIENLLNERTLSGEEIKQIIHELSPFEGNMTSNQFFDRLFPAQELILYSGRENISNNAGYQELAYLYAVVGELNRVKQCVDTLSLHHKDYYNNFQNNIFNIAGYVAVYGDDDQLNELIDFYSRKINIKKTEFFETWLSKCGYLSLEATSKFPGQNHNSNLDFMDDKLLTKIFDLFLNEIRSNSTSQDELNFNLSLYYKQRASILCKHYLEIGEDFIESKLDSLFGLAITHYKKVSILYAEQTTEVTERSFFNGFVQKRVKRRNQFLYPDYFQRVLNSRGASPRYFTDRYFQYLLVNKVFNDLYKKEEDLAQLTAWITNYQEFNAPELGFSTIMKLKWSDRVLEQMDSILTNHPGARALNSNTIKMFRIQQLTERGDMEKAYAYFTKLDLNQIKNSLEEGWFGNSYPLFYSINRIAGFLATYGKVGEAGKLVKTYIKPGNRIKAYSYICQYLTDRSESTHKEDAFIYLDSAMNEMEKLKDFVFFSKDPQIALVLSLASVGGQEMNNLSRKYVSSTGVDQQVDYVENWIKGIAATQNYYGAYSSIPDFASRAERMDYYNLILLQAIVDGEMDKEWSKYFNQRMASNYGDDIHYEVDPI